MTEARTLTDDEIRTVWSDNGAKRPTARVDDDDDDDATDTDTTDTDTTDTDTTDTGDIGDDA